MSQGIRTFIIPVEDIARARALYTTLIGVEPYVDQPQYVGFRIGDQEIGLDPNGREKGMTGPVGYHQVDDIDGSVRTLVDAGARVAQEVRDVGGGRRIATVVDPDGNPVGLLQDKAPDR